MTQIIDSSDFQLSEVLKELVQKSIRVVEIYKLVEDKRQRGSEVEYELKESRVLNAETDALEAIVKAQMDGDKELARKVISAAFELLKDEG